MSNEEMGNDDTQEDIEGQNPEENNEDNSQNEPDVKTLQAQKQHWKEKFEKLQNEVKESREKTEPNKSNATDKFDYADLTVRTYLKTEGVDNREDQDWLLSEAKELRKDPTELLAKKFYQEELKDRKDQREAESASPNGKGRGSGKTQADPDYWIAKGKLPKDQKLAEKVVNAKIKADDSNVMFDPIGE